MGVIPGRAGAASGTALDAVTGHDAAPGGPRRQVQLVLDRSLHFSSDFSGGPDKSFLKLKD